MANLPDPSLKLPSCGPYFDTIQSRKLLPVSLQEVLTSAFAQIPVSSFPGVPGGKVIEILSDSSILDAVQVLSEHNILAAPVRDIEATSTDWKGRYMGIVDYSVILAWVLENAELAAAALPVGSATVAGVGTAAVSALGAVALGAAAPVAMVGVTAAAGGAALASGVATERSVAKDSSTVVDYLGMDFYKLFQEEPFKSTMVKSLVETYQWAPFFPVAPDNSMLAVLLLLSKYRLRNVPVVESGQPYIKNFITQSAVVQGLKQCRGRDWFDCITSRPFSDLGLPFKSDNEVISVTGDELILEAFKRMKEHRIGGLPVVEGPNRKVVDALSIRDIRFLLLRPELFSSFRHLTVTDFIKTKQASFIRPGDEPSLVTCAQDACFGSVIDKLASKRMHHRIYVVKGDECEVVGVITLRDVISCFINEPPGFFDDYLKE